MDIYEKEKEKEKEKRINLILYERPIWFIFIFNSLLTILGTNYSMKSIIIESPKLERLARKLFLVASCFAFIIYTYFFNRNYTNYKNSLKDKDSDSNLLFIRSLGSILIIFGSILIIYFQLNQQGFIDTPDTEA